MNIIIFKRRNYIYIKQNFLDSHLDSAAHFLTDMFSLDSYRKWLQSDSTSAGSNEVFAEKHDNLIELSFLDYPQTCFVTQENFAQLLDQWETLYCNNTPSIMLYEENGKILLAPYEEDQA